MGLSLLFDKIREKLFGINPDYVNSSITHKADEYPYLPNYDHGLQHKSHGGESLRRFFIRMGYPYISYSSGPVQDVGQWVQDANMDCISSVLRVSRRAADLDLDNDEINDLGCDVGFIAFVNEEDYFLFKLRFNFY